MRPLALAREELAQGLTSIPKDLDREQTGTRMRHKRMGGDLSLKLRAIVREPLFHHDGQQPFEVRWEPVIR